MTDIGYSTTLLFGRDGAAAKREPKTETNLCGIGRRYIITPSSQMFVLLKGGGFVPKNADAVDNGSLPINSVCALGSLLSVMLAPSKKVCSLLRKFTF